MTKRVSEVQDQVALGWNAGAWISCLGAVHAILWQGECGKVQRHFGKHVLPTALELYPGRIYFQQEIIQCIPHKRFKTDFMGSPKSNTSLSLQDLNVIENIWTKLKKRRCKMFRNCLPQNKNKLWGHVLKAWGEISWNVEYFRELHWFHAQKNQCYDMHRWHVDKVSVHNIVFFSFFIMEFILCLRNRSYLPVNILIFLDEVKSKYDPH